MSLTVEVCAFSLESCLAAQAGGAGRVELCGGLYEGGTTPSAGLITLARKSLTISLYVMIRPRGGDFHYSASEFEVMKEDILTAKNLGADGVVLGILKPDGSIDVERTKALVLLASPLPVTFHRAFDMTADPFRALEEVILSGSVRILTSGQQDKALDGKELIAELVAQSNGRIEMMAGSGINAQNALKLLETGIQALHLTGKAAKDSLMQFRKADLSMGGIAGIPEYEITYTDTEKVRAVVEVVRQY